MRFLGLLAVFGIGCSGGDESTDDKTDSGAPTEETGTPTTDTTDPTGTTPTLGTARLQGTVRDAGGTLSGLQLRLCRGAVCRNGTTDAGGGFDFGQVPEQWHSFEVVPASGSGLATTLVPLSFAVDEVRTLDIVMQPLDAPSALGATAADHPTGAGLTLTLAADDLEPPLFVDPATAVAGVRVPEAEQVPVDGIPGTVVAMWYLSPFDHHAVDPAGIPARITDEWGLTDGQTLRVYVGSYEASAWLDAGLATASGGELTGAALPLLSTVIAVQE